MSHPDPMVPAYDGPAWVPFGEMRDAHWAAFRAFVHAPTACRLVMLWFAMETTNVANSGWFEWKVISPNGWEREVATGEDPPHLFDAAERTIRRLLEEISEAQLGG